MAGGQHVCKKKVKRLVLWATVLFIIGAPVSAEVRLLSTGWQYRWGDAKTWLSANQDELEWQAMDLPSWAPNRNKATQIWQRIKLPDMQLENPSLFLPGVFLHFEAYLDAELIYATHNIDSGAQPQFVGLPWHIISLGDTYANRTLSIRISSEYYLIGIGGTPFIGSRAEIYKRIIIRDIDRIVVASLCIFIGFFSLLLSVRFRAQSEFLFFFLFAFLVGLYVVFYTWIKQLFIDAPIFWVFLWLLSISIMPIGILGFVKQVFAVQFKQIFKILMIIHYAAVGILLPLLLIFTKTFGVPSLITFRLLYFVDIGLLCISSLRLAVKGNNDARIALAGLVLLAVFGINDVLMGLGFVSWRRPLAHIGMLFFTLAMGAILGRRLVQVYRNMQSYAKQVVNMSRDRQRIINELHDGIGGVMTNINLLSEIAKGVQTVDEREKIVATITSLSQEGLTEIRSFMRSLDDREMGWRAIAADLRLYGRKILEPRGIGLKMQVDVDGDVAPPDSLTYLNTHRIYRELLTNIVKHSKAKTVRVRICARNKEFQLQVEDDGVGFSGGGKDGRGIGSMTKRAEEIGGTIAFASDQGVTAVLKICPKNTQGG